MDDDKNLKPEIYRDAQVRAAIRELFSYQDFLDGMEAFRVLEIWVRWPLSG